MESIQFKFQVKRLRIAQERTVLLIYTFFDIAFCGSGSLAILRRRPPDFWTRLADVLFGVVTCWKGQYIPKRPLRSDWRCQSFRFRLSSSSNVMFRLYFAIFVTANHPCHVWNELFWAQPRSRIINGPVGYHLGAAASSTQLFPASYVTTSQTMECDPEAKIFGILPNFKTCKTG